MTNAVTVAQGASNNVTFRNRIINGGMVIDQRNAGAALTINASSNSYTVDRWVVENSTTGGVVTAQQSSTAPAGFNYSLKTTVTTTGTLGTSGYLENQYKIEGYNLADLNWGSANAKAITLSFWVQSSVTGIFGGSIANGGYNRSYSFLFTISSANTWEQKTVTIAGDTSGTWLTTNGIGAYVFINMGAGSSLGTTPNQWNASGSRAATGENASIIGTNGATFYITGVQLEAGTTASPFEYRQYGTELALCQRYFQTWGGTTSGDYAPWTGLGYNSTTAEGCFIFIAPMRSSPSFTQVGNWYFNDAASDNAAGTLGTGVTALQTTQMRSATATGLTGYRPYTLRGASSASRIQFSAEL